MDSRRAVRLRCTALRHNLWTEREGCETLLEFLKVLASVILLLVCIRRVL